MKTAKKQTVKKTARKKTDPYAKEKAARPLGSYGEPAWDSANGHGPSKEEQEDATRVLRGAYWTSIRAMAEDIVDRILSGEIENADQASEVVYQTADGSGYVIYTRANYLTLLCSDHDATEDLEDSGSPFTPAVAAYYCVRADLAEQVEVTLGCPVTEYRTTDVS
jgi:hypothetical protein